MGVLTSYGAHNLVIEQDYNFKFNSIEVGDPEVTIELSNNQPVVQVNTWWRGLQEETARWRYVGMDYETAQDCADNMRAELAMYKSVWGFGSYLSGSTLLYGYYKQQTVPQLQSDVTVVKNGNGAMYDVVVDARAEEEDYAKNKLPGITGTRELYDYVKWIDGWQNYSSGWNSGKAVSAATSANLVLVAAPTRLREFEIAGQDITMPVGDSLSNITFPIWYKCTDTYACQVKYTGMTLSACRALFNALNKTTGWWLSSHPYKYEYVPELSTFEWTEDENKKTWQCLNEFKATCDDGNMWTAELNLKAEKYQYLRNPTYAASWSWPSVWSKIPGLSNYL